MGARFTHKVRSANFSALLAIAQQPMSPELASQWAARYSAFLRRRFAMNSRGGGDWKPLSTSTIMQRRTKGSVGKKRRPGETSKFTRAKKVTRLYRQLQRAKSASAAAKAVGQIKALTSAEGTAILRDTGTLFRALTIGAPGNKFVHDGTSMTVGFDGATQHPSGKATIAEIAGYHNKGGGKLPKRTIIVAPDQQTINGMAGDYQRDMQRRIKGASAK